MEMRQNPQKQEVLIALPTNQQKSKIKMELPFILSVCWLPMAKQGWSSALHMS